MHTDTGQSSAIKLHPLIPVEALWCMAATLSHRLASSASITAVHHKRIVAIGDSLIYGYGDPEGGGWVERLRRRWQLQQLLKDGM